MRRRPRAVMAIVTAGPWGMTKLLSVPVAESVCLIGIWRDVVTSCTRAPLLRVEPEKNK